MKTIILMYHRVGDNSVEKQFTVSTTSFEQQLHAIRDLSYHVVSLDEVVAALEGKRILPEHSVAITFDDGFRDTFENAVPILRGLGYTATFFLVSQLMGTTNIWMERVGYPSAQLMTWSSAKELLKQGFAVGSHSRSHSSLTQLDEAKVSDEVQGSRQDIENILGTPIRYFAYPFGHVDDRARKAVERCGYMAACSTQSGFNNASTDRFQLRRLDIRGTDSTRDFIRSLVFGENSMTSRKAAQYYLKRFVGKIF